MVNNGTPTNKRKDSDFIRHFFIGIFTNLTAASLVAAVYFFEQPIWKLVVCIGALAICGVLTLVIKWIKPLWTNIKHIGFYFLPTTAIFLALAERQKRLVAEGTIRDLEKRIETLDEIILVSPDASIIERIISPEQQEESLKEIIQGMDKMPDARLARIVDRIRHYLGDILKSVGINGNYNLFRQLVSRLSSYDSDVYIDTYKQFLLLLSDIFGMSSLENLNGRLRKDMMRPLKHAILKVGGAHQNRVFEIITKIMTGDKNENEFSRDIIEMLLSLDFENKHELSQVIFNEGKKRAFRFPQHFGYDFLNVLIKLEHRVFYLDMQSLRDVLEESLNDYRGGLINSNQNIYEELCSKVFARLENPDRRGICHARLFRRLIGNNGMVKVECIFPGGGTCNCDGESLSFRGLYTKKCVREAGERFKCKIEPFMEAKLKLPITASVPPIHTDEHGNKVEGRGIFFEEAKENVVKDLYGFISDRRD